MDKELATKLLEESRKLAKIDEKITDLFDNSIKELDEVMSNLDDMALDYLDIPKDNTVSVKYGEKGFCRDWYTGEIFDWSITNEPVSNLIERLLKG